MNFIISLIARMPPGLVMLVVIGLSVAVTLAVTTAENTTYKKVCAYADSHHGRIESYVEHCGDFATTRYRVWLEDGSFVSDSELKRTNYK